MATLLPKLIGLVEIPGVRVNHLTEECAMTDDVGFACLVLGYSFGRISRRTDVRRQSSANPSTPVTMIPA
jgi:hypothetical protein